MLLSEQSAKGCLPFISKHPIALEPAQTPEFVRSSQALDTRLQLWISPEEAINWVHCESFIKQLSGIDSPIAFEVVGNKAQITISFLCDASAKQLLRTAFLSQFPCSQIHENHHNALEAVSIDEWSKVQFADYFPQPPYSHLLSSVDELKDSPLKGLLFALSQISDESLGFFQCLFQPTRQDWHEPVEMLTDVEYMLKLQSGMSSPRLQFQQSPSGDLRNLAAEVERKAHNDKPFFSVASRVGLIGSTASLMPLRVFMSLFQHGGKPLNWVDSNVYHDILNPSQIQLIFLHGLTYRHGFLLNSQELTGMVHPVAHKIIELGEVPIDVLNPINTQSKLSDGETLLGYAASAGETKQISITDDVRERGTHVISVSGCGKSTLINHMCLQDVKRGIGAVFIDPHGDGINDIMDAMPEEHLKRCIYFNPADQKHIPLWNPLYLPKGACRYRMADDLLSAFERVFTGWGDRLAHVLRNGLVGLSYLENPCLLDLYHLLRPKSEESHRLRKRILAQNGLDAPIRSFWEHDFLKDYRESELAAPKHKLSKLLGGSVYSMLSQPKSLINLGQVMDENKILLVDLSGLGSDTKEVLGSLLLSMLLMTALGRSHISRDERTPFSIFADECHMFVSADAIEQMIVQARKFKVRLTIAHQYLAQFKTHKVDALSTTGTSIVGRVNKDDSHFFAKDMCGAVKPDGFLKLEPYEFIARIGTELAHFRSVPLPRSPLSLRESIIAQSHEKYCVSAEALKMKLPQTPEFTPKRRIDLSLFEFQKEDFIYDTF